MILIMIYSLVLCVGVRGSLAVVSCVDRKCVVCASIM